MSDGTKSRKCTPKLKKWGSPFSEQLANLHVFTTNNNNNNNINTVAPVHFISRGLPSRNLEVKVAELESLQTGTYEASSFIIQILFLVT
jgi:hypothetical protein